MTVLPRYMLSDVLDWCTRTRHRIVDHRHSVAIAAVLVVALWCIGIAVAGESELENEQPGYYCHPKIAATSPSPSVAGEVMDPTVEAFRPPPVGSVTVNERCEG